MPIHDRLERRGDLLVHDSSRLVELEGADERREDDLELEDRKAISDAVARPVAERDEPAPAVRQLARGRDAPRGEPARGVELGCGRAPDVWVDVHGREGDVEDLASADPDGGEGLAGGSGDGLGEGDDVVTESNAFGLRGGGVEAETREVSQWT